MTVTPEENKTLSQPDYDILKGLERARQAAKTETSPDSTTNVHFSQSCLSGVRKPISIRIDTGLYSAFKPVSKRIYGSTCKAVETFMATLVQTVQTGVHFSDTGKPIQIGKIVIERGLRERRKLAFEEDYEEDKRGSEESVVWREHESKIIMPEFRPVLSPKSTVGKRVSGHFRIAWAGSPLNLEEILDRWGMISLEERLRAAEYARAYPNSRGAGRVLSWFASYKIHLKEKG